MCCRQIQGLQTVCINICLEVGQSMENAWCSTVTGYEVFSNNYSLRIYTRFSHSSISLVTRYDWVPYFFSLKFWASYQSSCELKLTLDLTLSFFHSFFHSAVHSPYSFIQITFSSSLEVFRHVHVLHSALECAIPESMPILSPHCGKHASKLMCLICIACFM